MAEALKGAVHGNHIELEQAPSVPDGSHVLVSIELLPVSDEAYRRRILELCGTWKNDLSIPAIFDEMARERHAHHGREIPIP